MVHSGSCTGKKWFVEFEQKDINKSMVRVVEKMGVSEVVIFSTAVYAQKHFGSKWVRPQKAVDLFEDFLLAHPTFDYERHAIHVNSKWFSLDSISRGLRKIGEVFNQPLIFRDEDK